jgi:LPXTG-motif cell wall-anchored protein
LRSLFGGSPFQPHAFSPSLGLTFTDLKATWDKYAPSLRTDAKEVRNEIAPATTAPSTSPGPATSASAALGPTSPTNLTTPPAYQTPSPSPGMTTFLLVVGGLALAGTGAWYFYFRNKK